MQRQGSTFLAFPKHAHHNAWLGVLRPVAIFRMLLRHGSGVTRGDAGKGYALYLVHFPLIPLAAIFAGDQGSAVFWIGYLSLCCGAVLVVNFEIHKAFMQIKSTRTDTSSRSFKFAGTEVVPS